MSEIGALLNRKPMAGLDILTMASRHFHAAQGLVRARAARNPNEVIEENLTMGDRVADLIARFGGSWYFIILFGVGLVSALRDDQAAATASNSSTSPSATVAPVSPRTGASRGRTKHRTSPRCS